MDSEKKIYCAVIILSALASIGRPDYNLPLFGLLYVCSHTLVGEKRWRQQRFFLVLIVCSIVFDIAYILYWSTLWFSKNWLEWTHRSYRLSVWTMCFSALTLLAKVGCVIYVFRPELMQVCGLKTKVDVIEEYDIYQYSHVPQ